MRFWVATLLVLTAAFAGCADEPAPDDGAAPDPAQTSSATQTSTQTSSSGTSAPPQEPGSPAPETNETEPANEPPHLNLSADATQALTGETVTFTINGSDPEGETLAWNLTLAGEVLAEGTDLPSTYEHSFADPGAFSFTATITDGAFQVNQTIEIVVTQAGPVFTYSGSTAIPIQVLAGGVPFATNDGGTGALGCAGFVTGENEIDCIFSELPAGLDGRSWETTGSASTEFWDACDPTGSVAAGYTHDETGAVPAGAGCVVMFYWGAGTSTMGITVY